MPVRRDLLGGVTDGVEGLGGEPQRRIHVALLAEQRLDEIPLPVDGVAEVAPAPVDPDIRLIRVPLDARRAAPFWSVAGRPAVGWSASPSRARLRG